MLQIFIEITTFNSFLNAIERAIFVHIAHSNMLNLTAFKSIQKYNFFRRYLKVQKLPNMPITHITYTNAPEQTAAVLAMSTIGIYDN